MFRKKIDNRLNIRNTSKIVNVFKQHYINNVGMGIGDFFRGSFFLMQFCDKFNLDFDVDLSQHPASQFLKKSKQTTIQTSESDYNSVLYLFHDTDQTLHMFESIKTFNKPTCYLYTNNHPNKNNILHRHKTLLKNIMIPNNELLLKIKTCMNQVNIIPTKYKTIHIRAGDKYLLNNEPIDHKLLNKVMSIIKTIIDEHSDEDLLLISDSSELKTIIKSGFPQIKTIPHKIGHMVYCNDVETIENCLIDLFLASQSSEVIGMSVYGHKTGFSEYTSIIFDIPYKYYDLYNC